MIVAGFGLRASASLPGLRGLLADIPVDALAIVADKAGHPALRALAAERALPLVSVALADLAGDRAATPAPHQPGRYGPTSVAEAAALAAALAASSASSLVSLRFMNQDNQIQIS
mgnify:CR=1 FL=1